METRGVFPRSQVMYAGEGISHQNCYRKERSKTFIVLDYYSGACYGRPPLCDRAAMGDHQMVPQNPLSQQTHRNNGGLMFGFIFYTKIFQSFNG